MINAQVDILETELLPSLLLPYSRNDSKDASMSFLLLLATVLLDFLGTLVANLIVVGPWHIVSSSFCLSLFRYIFNEIATSLYFSLRLSKFSDAEFLFLVVESSMSHT